MRSFDPWGQLRNADWTVPGAPAMLETARGFTGHEHLDNVGLIHMNGRVYDPKLGRMLSADPFVQFPADTQSFNRYAYVNNNPLSFADPIFDTMGPDASTARQAGAWTVMIGTAVTPFGKRQAARASVDELVRMMNKRPGVKAEFASGDMERYLRSVGAEGSSMLLENGTVHIVLRRDVATRLTALHEWTHRTLWRRNGGYRPGEDEVIEAFLERHSKLLGVD